MNETEDWADVQAALGGDESAFERIIARHQAAVAALLWKFTRDPVVLRELVQETFVRAYYSLSGYAGRAPLVYWLRSIATRVGYRHWKHAARERRNRDAAEAWHLNRFAAEAETTPSEAAEVVYQVLAALPAKDRVVLTLLYFEQWGVHEIAGHLGWSAALVKVRAFRARKRLRALLEEAGVRSAAHE